MFGCTIYRPYPYCKPEEKVGIRRLSLNEVMLGAFLREARLKYRYLT
jgi:hypothetical protein